MTRPSRIARGEPWPTATAFPDRRDDTPEGVVAQYDIGRLARDFGAAQAHGHSNVGLL